MAHDSSVSNQHLHVDIEEENWKDKGLEELRWLAVHMDN